MNVFSGFFIGIVYVAAPGPINLETFRRGLNGGLMEALAVQAGASIGLIGYALCAILGSGLLLQSTLWQVLLGLAGMTMLFYMGISTIRDGWRLPAIPNAYLGSRTTLKRAFGAGALLSLTNPLDFLFWMAIADRASRGSHTFGIELTYGVLLGCFIASLGMAIAFGIWRIRFSSRAASVFSAVCGVSLIGFGLNIGFSLGKHLLLW
jgi:threonine/homoserine/homoserine lactone efflux protein